MDARTARERAEWPPGLLSFNALRHMVELGCLLFTTDLWITMVADRATFGMSAEIRHPADLAPRYRRIEIPIVRSTPPPAYSCPDSACLIRSAPARGGISDETTLPLTRRDVRVDVFPTQFYGTVWPLQPQRPLGTAQPMGIVLWMHMQSDPDECSQRLY